jgi:hypothetical protein
MKPSLLLLLVLTAALSAQNPSWQGISAPFPIRDIAPTKDGIWLATGGGMRYVDKSMQTTELTASSGLGETPQSAVVIDPDSTVYTVSASGVIARFLPGKGFEVISRTYTEGKRGVVKGLLLSKANYLVLGFQDKISFFDVKSKISRISVSKIGSKVLSNANLGGMVLSGDTLFVALDSSVYRRTISFDKLESEFDLGDPETWKFQGKDSTGVITDLWFEKGSLRYTSNVRGLLEAQGLDTQDTVYCPTDSTCTVKWMASSNSDMYWAVGERTLFKVQKGARTELSAWNGVPELPVTTLVLLPDGGVAGWAMSQLLWVGPGMTSIAMIPYLPLGAIDDPPGQSYNQPLKGMVLNKRGHLILGGWGGGYLVYSGGSTSQGGAWALQIHPWTTGACMEPFSQAMIIVRGISAPDGTAGFVGSHWNDDRKGYGISYVDTNYRVHCLNQIGSTHASGPLASALDSSTGNWQFFSAFASSGQSYTSGGLDWLITSDPERTGEFSLLSKIQISGENFGYARDIAWDPKYKRLWLVSSTTAGWWDPTLSEIIPVYSMTGFKGADFTSVEVDAQGNPWFGTRGQGIYHGRMLHGSPDSLVLTQYLPRNGLLSETVVDLKIDASRGTVWTAHDIGISRFMTTDVRAGEQFQKPGAANPYAYPNPFRPAIHSQLVLDRISSLGVVRIYDSGQNLVRKFQGAELAGGRLLWNGKTDKGQLVSPGVYTWVSTVDGKSSHGRILVVR